MGYRPLAELYSSHRIPTAPFGIEMGEIPPGSPQEQLLSSIPTLAHFRLKPLGTTIIKTANEIVIKSKYMNM